MTVDDLLFEEPELIVDAVTVSGKILAGQRVEEAGRQSPQAAIAQGGIGFDFLNLFEVGTHFDQGLLAQIVQVEIVQGIAQGPTHQKFDRQVIQTLGIAFSAAFFRCQHPIDHKLANGQGNRLKPVIAARPLQGFCGRVFQVAPDGFLESGFGIWHHSFPLF